VAHRKSRGGRTLKHPTSLRLLLITGIPATGKTCMGEHLRELHGFKHADFEGPQLGHYLPDGITLDRARIEQLKQQGRDAVITWGFVPDTQLAAVLVFRDLGFRWVWFDGDRESALREYLALGRLKSDWDRQLGKISAYIDPWMDSLAPVIVNTFDADGQRRALCEVARDVLAQVEPEGGY
jgi:hypothetical protein